VLVSGCYLTRFTGLEVVSRESRTIALIEILILEIDTNDQERWDEIRIRLFKVGTAAFEIISQPLA
jgi:hypothetical protein